MRYFEFVCQSDLTIFFHTLIHFFRYQKSPRPLSVSVLIDLIPESVGVVWMNKMCHLMHNQIIQHPFWHLCNFVGYPDTASSGCATSPSLFLICDKFDGIYRKLPL